MPNKVAYDVMKISCRREFGFLFYTRNQKDANSTVELHIIRICAILFGVFFYTEKIFLEAKK